MSLLFYFVIHAYTNRMRLYLDTSVFSAYVDERSPERMRTTHLLWSRLVSDELFCSSLTLDEIEHAGDERAKQMRDLTVSFHVVGLAPKTLELAQAYVAHGVVSPRHIANALHVAAAVQADADILLSWNYTHLVNRRTRLLVNYVNAVRGVPAIELLAPPEL